MADVNEQLIIASQAFTNQDYFVAEAAYKQILKTHPHSADVINNLAAVYNATRREDKALALFKKSARLNPSNPITQSNLGTILLKLGKPKSALHHLNLALKLNPQDEEANFYMGVYCHSHKLDNARYYYEKTLQSNPRHLEALNNLAIWYAQSGHFPAAFKLFRQALQVNPLFGPTLAHYAYQLKHACQWEDLPQIEKQLDSLQKTQVFEEPMMSIIRHADPRENFRIAKWWSEKFKPPQKAGHRLTPSKKISIGFVSDGFRDFPTAHNLVGVLENLDKSKFKVFLYHLGPSDNSIWARRINKAVPRQTDLTSLDDHQAAQIIIRDKIEILVDLKGYLLGNRIGIFARRPAPIQISYLGFPGTTGAGFLDYIIADKTVIPETEHKYYSEKVLYLPDSYRPTDNGFFLS